MKRFLSILLASMMILGCMAVTVSADVTFALETGDTLTALASDPTVEAGRKVMVNKIEGATYYRNGVALAAADVVDGPKANTVALPVIEGGNVFQVVANGEVSSDYVYVKGTNHTIDDEGSVQYDVTTNDYLKMTEITDETVLAEINPDGSRTTIGKNYYGYRGAVRNDLDNMYSDTAGVEAADKAVLSTDCYIKDLSTATLTNGAFALGIATKGTVSGTSKFTLGGIGVEADGSLYISHSVDGGSYARAKVLGTTVDTGVSTTFGTWHNYAAVVFESTMTVDYYFDNVLIAKSMITRSDYDAGSFQGASFTGGGTAVKTTDSASLVYFDNMIGETTAIAATVSATPDQPYDIVPEGGDDDDEPVEPAVLVTGTIADGITINRAALEDASTVVAVVAVDEDGVPTVQLSDETTANNTFAVAGAEKVFVWNWATLAPLCAVIE